MPATPTTATTNARRLITESKVDVLIGSSTTPPTIAVSTVANEAAIPHFSLAPMPVNEARAKWSVVMPQPVPLMAKVMFEHMKKNNVKTVGLIGFSDSWGDLWLNEFKNQGVPMGLELVADERFARPDTSVAGQVLKLVVGQAGRRAGRRLRHRRGPAAGDPARAQLRRADLPDPRRGEHGFHPHRRQGGGERDHGVGSGDGAGRPGRQRADQEAGPRAERRLRRQVRRQHPQPVRRAHLRRVRDPQARHSGGAEDGKARHARSSARPSARR